MKKIEPVGFSACHDKDCESVPIYECHHCGTPKPIADFYVRAGKVMRPCKACCRVRDKVWRESNATTLREATKTKRRAKASQVSLIGREALLTVDRLKLVLHYDPETGRFSRLIASGGAQVGSEPGYYNENGYRIISVDSVKYRAHRLAWLYMTGAWPKEDVDHKNNTPDDNRWENLREATDAQNLQNIGMPKHNTSGLKGASWQEDKQKWRASICSRGKWRHLGYFSSKEEAHAAYCAAALELNGEFANFG